MTRDGSSGAWWKGLRRRWPWLVLVLTVLPSIARAGDIGEAVRYAQPIMKHEDLTKGLEDFIEEEQAGVRDV